jgi:endogenous inhibitor of DNA gyrase (YacG/DUF329 family)
MKCPICKKDSIKIVYPFCSEKHQLVDLYNWFEGEYCFSEELPPITDDNLDLPEPFWREDD